MDGDVSVESVHGEGSTFTATMLLPKSSKAVDLKRESDREALIEKNKSTATRKSPSPKSANELLSGRVLLVEDGIDNQRLITLLLKKMGLEAEIAENGKLCVEAVEAAIEAGDPFDVVLMDMQMPVMGGVEATELLRAREHEVPIIALTANAISGDRERCLEGGMNDYIAKPIDPTQMAEKIRDWCGRSAQGEPAKPLRDLIEILDDLARRPSNA